MKDQKARAPIAPTIEAPKNYNSPANDSAVLSSRSTATEVQIDKLIATLKRRPCHTHELRMMGISHPAGRVHDLVKRGYTIQTARVSTVDSDSFQHVGVALYTLVAEPEGAGQ